MGILSHSNFTQRCVHLPFSAISSHPTMTLQPTTSLSDRCTLRSLEVSQPHQTSVSDFHAMVVVSMSLPDGRVDLTRESKVLVTLSKVHHYPGQQFSPATHFRSIQISPGMTTSMTTKPKETSVVSFPTFNRSYSVF